MLIKNKTIKNWSDFAGPNGFWGFGSSFKTAEIIFLGLEFGGEHLERRIAFWENAKKVSILDAPDFHEFVEGEKNWLKLGNLRIGKTYAQLSATLVGKDIGQRKKYIQTTFGATKDKNLWIDLSALPCKNISSQEFKKKYRMDRDDYESNCLPGRVKRIKKELKTFKGILVLYGWSPYWNCLFDDAFAEVGNIDGFPIRKIKTKNVYQITHPTNRRGVTLNYFEYFGREYLKKKF